MVAKKIVVGILVAGVIASLGVLFLANKTSENQVSNTTKEDIKPVTQSKKIVPVKKSFDLYSNSIYDLPLTSIVDISKMPKSLKEVVDKTLEESQGFYLLNYNEDEKKVFIILQNPLTQSESFSRHNLEFLELYINQEDGKILKNLYSPAHTGIPNEIFLVTYDVYNNDEHWDVDKKSSPVKPFKHIIYDAKNKPSYIETWNYDDNKDIRYQFKDGNKKTISLLKEYKQGDIGLRKEHLFYDKDGSIMTSLTINYEGANITRVMYYDKHNAEESRSIVTYYENGQKIKEEVFDKDYKLSKIITAEYADDERIKISSTDVFNEKVEEFTK